MDTPIVIIMVCYIASFSILGVQSIVGDPMGIDMQSFNEDTGKFDGDTMANKINEMSDTFSGCYTSEASTPPSELIGGFNNQTYVDKLSCHFADNTNQWLNGTGASYSSLTFQTARMQLTMAEEATVTNNPITSAASQVFQLFQIITGTYAFNLLVFIGIPEVFVVGISMIYVILLSIWTIMLLRGNNVS
jgi:hypothetical protein